METSELLQKSWTRLSAIPGGKAVFSRIVGQMIPYTGSIGAKVVMLSPGYARVQLEDRRAIRNHLKSVHAIALANLGEFVSGLAVNYGLPKGSRAILKRISVDYLKKARGKLTATSEVVLPPAGSGRQELAVEAEIRNEKDEVVTRVAALWVVDQKS